MNDDDRRFFQEQFKMLFEKLENFDARIRATEQCIIEIKTEIRAFKLLTKIFGTIWGIIVAITAIIAGWFKGD